MTRVALDTNILANLGGVVRVPEDDSKVARVRALVDRLSDAATLVTPVQALGEFFVVLRRSGASPGEAREMLLEFAETFGTAPSEARTALAAADLAVDHQLQFRDSLIVAAAADAGCSLLLSEDMQHGFVTRGLTIVDPLAEEMPVKLAELLRP